MDTRPYRTVGYRRVSSREQLDGHSLDAQETHIKTFVETQGWSLVQIYTDAGISAKKGSRRPALEQLLRDAKDGLFDVVVVDKIDRFYRHLGGLLTTLEQLNSSGVSFASVQEKLDFTTPWGKLMLTVLGMLAEIYLDNLRQETKKGQHQRVRKGLWLGGVPFGYCKGLCADCEDPNGKEYCPHYGEKNLGDGKNLIAHPIESQVVKMVFDWYISGNYSESRITEMLNQTTLQLSDGSEVPVRQKGRKGCSLPGPLGRDVVREMIHRLAYTGKLPYHGLDDAGRHRKRCPPKEVFNGNQPALISQEVFDRAQEVCSLAYRHPMQKKGKVCRMYPLTGILKCGYCGGRMRGESAYDRRVYSDARRIDRTMSCRQKQVGASILEQQVIEFLRDVAEHSNGKEELNVLENQIKAAEERLERARELYLAGEINRLVYDEERSRLETLEKDLRFNTKSATIASIGVIHSGITRWNELSQYEHKRLLRLALDAAWVREKAIVAVQPSIALLSLLSGKDGNMGNIGIRTRG